MWIFCRADDSHELSSLYFLWKSTKEKFNTSPAAFLMIDWISTLNVMAIMQSTIIEETALYQLNWSIVESGA